MTGGYVELHAHSAYSFLDGASLPEELAARAAELGYDAFALTDHDGVYGSLEFAHAAKHFGLRAITGRGGDARGRRPRHAALREPARLREPLPDPDRRARRHARRGPGARAAAGRRRRAAFVADHAEGLVCLSGCARHGLGVVDPNAAARLARAFPGRVLRRAPAAVRARRRAPQRRARRARRGARRPDGRHRRRPRAPPAAGRLQDALVAIRHRTSLDGSERERRGNHESVAAARRGRWPSACRRDAAARTREVADRCTFDLTQELGYRYPDFSDGPDPADAQLQRRSASARSPTATPRANRAYKRRARERLERELALIARLGLAGFFLLHWEVLELARECALEVRGRRLAAERAAAGTGEGLERRLDRLLPHRALARRPGRGEPLARAVPERRAGLGARHRPRLPARHPREADRRRHRALRPRARRARRELLDLPQPRRDPRRRQGARPARSASSSGSRASPTAGTRPASPRSSTRVPGDHGGPRWQAFRELTHEIAGLPRHLSQHPGGMVISTRPLIDLVPVQPAAMAGRQICQWDKDSCADAGFLKIDLLGLGMLSAVEEAVDQIARLHGEPIDLSRIPLDDPEVYAEIQAADTVGVFQIESRAQMQSLLRTRPENLDDLTVQVALVRPGPIQGKAVHPYIERRAAAARGPGARLSGRARVAARAARARRSASSSSRTRCSTSRWRRRGFSVGEAEGLRRAMSRKRSEEAIEAFRPRFVEGCLGTGSTSATAHAIYDKLVGFSGFGFPKSHAAAFAPARLPVGLAAALLPGRVPLLAPERAADGLLPAGVARARRAAARRRGAPAAREPQRRRGARSRTGARADRARLHPLGRRGGGRGARRRAAVRGRRRPRPPRRRRQGRARGARRRRRLRRVGAAARAALAARR